jgi:hypothetical protein
MSDLTHKQEVLKLTPAQKTKCQLLGITIGGYDSSGNRNPGYFVVRSTLSSAYNVLCTPSEDAPIMWPTKRFGTINEAIEAAADPEKFGLDWD